MKICISCMEKTATHGKQCKNCYEDDLFEYNKEMKKSLSQTTTEDGE